MNREPLLTVAGITSAVAALLGALVAFGLELTGDQEKAILGIAAVAAPLIVAALTRPKVTPVEPVAPAGRHELGYASWVAVVAVVALVLVLLILFGAFNR